MVRQARSAASGGAQRRGVAQGPRLAELARGHAEAALDALVEIAIEGGSEAARISAANAILDRAYGKPGAGGGDALAPDGPTNPKDLSDDELLSIASAGGARAAAPPEGA